MRFRDKKEAIAHYKKIAGQEICDVVDNGSEVVISAPTKESGYDFVLKQGELHYEEKYKITTEDNGGYYESWVKDRSGKWIKSII